VCVFFFCVCRGGLGFSVKWLGFIHRI
jgi:hypothetical protein